MTYQKISSPYVTTTDPTTRTDSAPTNTRPVLPTAVAAVRGPQYAGMAYQRGRTIGHQRTAQREHAGEMLGNALEVVVLPRTVLPRPDSAARTAIRSSSVVGIVMFDVDPDGHDQVAFT